MPKTMMPERTPPALSGGSAADPYRSRVDAEWEAVPRVDPVVWDGPAAAATPHHLDPTALAGYRDAGFHLATRRFDAAETAGLLAEADRLASAAAASGPTEGVIIEPGSRAVRSLFRVHETSAVFRDVARDPRLVDVARQLLGGEVAVHQSRINFKPALDGKEFFWHSDFETWHIEDGMPRMRAVSVSLFLTPSTEFNGPLLLVPGSHHTFIRCVGATPANHHETSLRKQEYGVPSAAALRQLVEAGGIVSAQGPAGTAVFFECNLMHGSVGNLSPWPRTNVFIVYTSVHNALEQPFGGRPPRPEFLAARDPVPLSRW
jgi:ectoine hydroxylase